MIVIRHNGWFPSLNKIYGSSGKMRYLLPKVAEYRREFQMLARSCYSGKPLNGDISVKAEITFGDKRKHDIQNCLKIELDTLNGFIYEDDSQVCYIEMKKFYQKSEPSLVLKIEEL